MPSSEALRMISTSAITNPSLERLFESNRCRLRCEDNSRSAPFRSVEQYYNFNSLNDSSFL